MSQPWVAEFVRLSALLAAQARAGAWEQALETQAQRVMLTRSAPSLATSGLADDLRTLLRLETEVAGQAEVARRKLLHAQRSEEAQLAANRAYVSVDELAGP